MDYLGQAFAPVVAYQLTASQIFHLHMSRCPSASAVVSILTAVFLYLYSKKKRALLLARNHRTVSTLRLENIRNRLSPHFIFNMLNREMAERNVEGKQELSSLVKLMRRNLELVEQLCVTLAEELPQRHNELPQRHNELPQQHNELPQRHNELPQQH